MARPLMRCFTDEELRRGLDAVIQGHDRCAVCGARNDDPYACRHHVFEPVDPLNLFLEGAPDPVTIPDPAE